MVSEREEGDETESAPYLVIHGYLSLGCCNRNTTDLGLKQHTVVSHSSGSGEVQDQGANRSGVRQRVASWFVDAVFLLWPRTAESRERGGALGSFSS